MLFQGFLLSCFPSRFPGFLVSFFRFPVSWFPGLLFPVSWFPDFLVSWFPFCFILYFWVKTESVPRVSRPKRPSQEIGQSQSPLNTSTGWRETMNGRQKVSNKESVTQRKPRGDQGTPGKTERYRKSSTKSLLILEGESRKPWENRKSTTKSRSPLAGESRNPGENRKSPTKSQSPLKAGNRIKEIMGTWDNGKSTTKSPSRNPTGGCGNRFCLQLNGSFPCGKAIGVSRYFLRLAWVLHDSLKVARLNLAATSMGIPMETMVYRCCPDSHFCHDFSNLYLYLVILSRGHMLVAACGCCWPLLAAACCLLLLAAACCCCLLLLAAAACCCLLLLAAC